MTLKVLPVDRLRGRFHLRNKFHSCLLAEFLGTFMLLFLVTGIGAQFVLTSGKLNAYINLNIGVGFAIALCVYATYNISGAHLNPAVSIAVVSQGLLSIPHFFAYCLVQTLGAFLGVALSYAVYSDQIFNFTGGVKAVNGTKATAGLFCSFPEPHVSNLSCFIDQVVGTFILLFFIAAVIDKRNRVPSFLHPLFFGFILVVIGNSYGMNVGYPINPARDFGPRLFAYFIGYGKEVFTYHNNFFWIPIVAPLIGGPLGTWTYQTLLGIHLTDPEIDGTELPTKVVLKNGGIEELKPLSEE
ncbi:Major intrinsic protein domain containing protein [Aphelenchoides bicaudatus]|nr:Major intrinsic protein domain containing protein [Aphelenchoides bicaudatus]